MPSDARISVVHSDGSVENFVPDILKWNLVDAHSLPLATASEFVNELELALRRRHVTSLSTDDIRHVVHDLNTEGAIKLAVNRLVEETLPPTAVLASTEDYDTIAYVPGPTGLRALADDTLVATIARVDPDYADAHRWLSRLVIAATNHAFRDSAPRIVGSIQQTLGLSNGQASMLSTRMLSNLGPTVFDVGDDRLRRLALEMLSELETPHEHTLRTYSRWLRGRLSDESGLPRPNPEPPPEYREAPRAYKKVGSLERRNTGQPLDQGRIALYCRKLVDPDRDDLDGGETTYQPYEAFTHLFTNDYPVQEKEYVYGALTPGKKWEDYKNDGGWALDKDDLTTDLPPLHTVPLRLDEIQDDVFTWHLVEREETGSVIDKVIKAAREGLKNEEDNLQEKAKEFAEGVINDLGSFASITIPRPVENALSSAIKQIISWIIDQVVKVLDQRPRPFPLLMLLHRTIWPSGYKPLSIVSLAETNSSDSGASRVTLSERRSDGVIVQRPFPGREDVWWLGESGLPGSLPRGLMEQAGAGDAVMWRPRGAGFGAVKRQRSTEGGRYVVAVRADVRIPPIVTSPSTPS